MKPRNPPKRNLQSVVVLIGYQYSFSSSKDSSNNSTENELLKKISTKGRRRSIPKEIGERPIPKAIRERPKEIGERPIPKAIRERPKAIGERPIPKAIEGRPRETEKIDPFDQDGIQKIGKRMTPSVSFRKLLKDPYQRNLGQNQYHLGSEKNQTLKEKQLPGILIDLYQAYLFALRSLPTKIVIITDIDQDQVWRDSLSAMGKNIVDSGILDFISTVRKKGIYLRHQNKKWLQDTLVEIFRGADRVLFYYTGHGKDGYLEIPSKPNLLEKSNLNISPINTIGITLVKNHPLVKNFSSLKFSPTLQKIKSLEIVSTNYPSEKGFTKKEHSSQESNYQGEIGITFVEKSTLKAISKTSFNNLSNDRNQLDQIGLSKFKGNDRPLNKFRSHQKNENQSEFLEMEEIRRICFSVAKEQVEALFIFDCCNSTGLGLTYKLRPDGVFRLSERIPRDLLAYCPMAIQPFPNGRQYQPLKPITQTEKQNNCLLLDRNIKFDSPNLLNSSCQTSFGENTVGQSLVTTKLSKMATTKRYYFKAKAICISSSAPKQESISTTDGSLFTRHLFECLSSGERSLFKIKRILEKECGPHSQTATIYSTYPSLRFLWKWLYGGETRYRVEVELDPGLIILTPIE